MEEKYKGYDQFKELLEDKVISEGTIISIEKGEDYMVNSQGKLEIMTTGEPPYLPKFVLSEKQAPYGWTVK